MLLNSGMLFGCSKISLFETFSHSWKWNEREHRAAIGWDDIKEQKYIPFPSLPEQHTIIAFLDHETARIDRLIAQQQRLIELLKEKRQAVISHAVTKGLNPDAPMKDSGIEWLGQVPAHWSVVKLSYVLSLKSGDGITSNEIEPEGTYPVYGGNGLRGYCEQFNCNGTYALIGRQGALCGNVNVADGKFASRARCGCLSSNSI